jgi:thiol:disulfide interchange protein DsbD
MGGAITSTADELTGVDLQLISEQKTIAQDEPFTVGLRVHHHEGYHSYWRCPGIVGVPTSIKWTLPAGFSAGPIQWPHPELVDMAGHPAHGFHRDVLLMVEITPPAKLTSAEATLSAEVAWMACAKTCHPGHTTLTLTLPVGDKSSTNKDTAQQFEAARKELPNPSLPPGWSLTILTPPEAPRIKVTLKAPVSTRLPQRGLRFYSADGQVSSNTSQVVARAGKNELILSFERSEYGPAQATSLPGVLFLPEASHQATLPYFSISPNYPSQQPPPTP